MHTASDSPAPTTSLAVPIATAAPILAPPPSAPLPTSLGEANRQYKDDKDFFAYVHGLAPDALFAQLKQETLNQIIGEINNAPRYTPERMQHLLVKNETLVKLLEAEVAHNHTTIFSMYLPHMEYLLGNASASAMARLLNQCDGCLFGSSEIRSSKKLEDTILAYILTNESYCNPSLLQGGIHLVTRWIKASWDNSSAMMNEIRYYWMLGEDFSPFIQKILFDSIFKKLATPSAYNIKEQVDSDIYCWLLQKLPQSQQDAKHYQSAAVDQPASFICTSKGTFLIAPEDLKNNASQMLQTIWQQGFSTPIDCRRMLRVIHSTFKNPSASDAKTEKNNSNTIEKFESNVRIMYHAGVLFRGSQVPANVFEGIIVKEQAASDVGHVCALLADVNISLITSKNTVLNPYAMSEELFMEALWQEGASHIAIREYLSAKRERMNISNTLHGMLTECMEVFARFLDRPPFEVINSWRIGAAGKALKDTIDKRWSFEFFRPRHAAQLLAELDSKKSHLEKFTESSKILDIAMNEERHPSYFRSAKTRAFYLDIHANFFLTPSGGGGAGPTEPAAPETAAGSVGARKSSISSLALPG